MSKQVRETTAGRSISAYVVLNRKGEHVATVQSHYSDGGTVTVDVWSHGDATNARNWKTARANGRVSDKDAAALITSAPDYYTTPESREDWAAFKRFNLQHGRAGGYGYDKFAAAIAGLIIDGHTLANHCGQVPEDESKRAALFRAYRRAVAASNGGLSTEARKNWQDKADRLGCNFNNWQEKDGQAGWTNLYFLDGLSRLERLGYRVIQAI